jgi:PmbA protein
MQKVDKAILITDLMGDATNLVTGDYSCGASGFWVEKGEIQYPVEEITIAGKLQDIFQNILAVGEDWEPSSATRCGSILISEMMVGAT